MSAKNVSDGGTAERMDETESLEASGSGIPEEAPPPDPQTAKPKSQSPISGSESGVNENSVMVYIPGMSRGLKKSEEMVCDKSAYKLLKPFQCENPCLSLDIVPDKEGGGRESMRDGFPVSATIVAGTQAEKVRDNGIVVMNLSNLPRRKQKEEEEEDEESSSSESEEDESSPSKKPLMLSSKIPHHGGINRIRVGSIWSAVVCACWNDQGKVQLWNLENSLKAIEDLGEGKSTQHAVLKQEKPLFSFLGHQCEGFALDWSPVSPGRLGSGDNRGRIHVWRMGEGGEWKVDQRPYAHHTSVEDIQWSPTEENVLGSCSSDGSIRLWDVRISPTEACVCTVEKAHDSDVNVISWNRKDPFLLSGGDDGTVKVWDLKTIQHKQPVAVFKHHVKPITSLEWYPHDSTVFGVSGEDDQVTIWDLALEADHMDERDEEAIPPQLLFVHSGQRAIKEIRWHPQVVGVLTTTAQDGFNIFRTINM